MVESLVCPGAKESVGHLRLCFALELEANPLSAWLQLLLSLYCSSLAMSNLRSPNVTAAYNESIIGHDWVPEETESHANKTKVLMLIGFALKW